MRAHVIVDEFVDVFVVLDKKYLGFAHCVRSKSNED
jgi:hypothetical protein